MNFRFSKEIRIAVLTIVAGTMLYTGFNFLKGQDTFSSINFYPVYYNNVDGLVPGNPVYVNGLTVGQVKELSLEDGNKVKALLQVDASVKLTDSTLAKLMDGSLLGGKSIILELKPGKRELKDGDEILPFVQPGLAEALMKEEKHLMKGLDKTLYNVNEVLNIENQKKLSKMLTNLESLTRNANALVEINKSVLASSLVNINKLTGSLVQTEKQLKPILSNLNALSDSLKDTRLKATVEQANKAVANLDVAISKINSGKGTMGKLVNDDSLYLHMDKTVKDLDLVFLDLKARPGRYIHFSVFGKKNK